MVYYKKDDNLRQNIKPGVGEKWLISSTEGVRVRLDGVDFGRSMSYNLKINTLLDVYESLQRISDESGVGVEMVLGMVKSISRIVPKKGYVQEQEQRLDQTRIFTETLHAGMKEHVDEEEVECGTCSGKHKLPSCEEVCDDEVEEELKETPPQIDILDVSNPVLEEDKEEKVKEDENR